MVVKGNCDQLQELPSMTLLAPVSSILWGMDFFVFAPINAKASFIPQSGNPEVSSYSQPNRTIVRPHDIGCCYLFKEKLKLFAGKVNKQLHPELPRIAIEIGLV